MKQENTGKRELDFQIVKRTFEFTLHQQEELRDTIQMLIKENRCLTDAERRPYFLQVSRASIGMGRDFPFLFEIEETIGKEKIGSIEYFARFLGMQTETPVKFTKISSITRKKYVIAVPIGKLWEGLLFALFDVFPLALDRASAMSKEYEPSSGGDSYGFKP